MNILIIGSGGREHALAWKLHQSRRVGQLFVAPGNGGTAKIATNVNIAPQNFEAIREFARQNNIRYIVVGPEQPLVEGIFDYFVEEEGIYVIGPSKAAAQLEGSKAFAKSFMSKYNIPTAPYRSFSSSQLKEAYDFLQTLKPPYVLKASGLAAGKGVVIVDDLDQARNEIRKMFEGKFGAAGRTVVIEQFLDGIELSVFVLIDGKNYTVLPTSKDYKRVGEGDTGPNTGGMGAVSPMPWANEVFIRKVEDTIIRPTITGLRNEGLFYRGFLYLGLMMVEGDPFVLEYNVRLGDPETQVVLPRIKTDFVDILEAMAHEQLDSLDIYIDEQVAATVVLASQGYPGKYDKGKVITGLEKISQSIVFHAGTKITDKGIITNGGRVMAITAMGDSLSEALGKVYNDIDKIHFKGKYFRKDIGYEFV